MTTRSASDALRYGLGREFLKLYAVTLVGLWLFVSPVSRVLRPVGSLPLEGPLHVLFSVVGLFATVAGFALFAGGIVGIGYRLQAD